MSDPDIDVIERLRSEDPIAGKVLETIARRPEARDPGVLAPTPSTWWQMRSGRASRQVHGIRTMLCGIERKRMGRKLALRFR